MEWRVLDDSIETIARMECNCAKIEKEIKLLEETQWKNEYILKRIKLKLKGLTDDEIDYILDK